MSPAGLPAWGKKCTATKKNSISAANGKEVILNELSEKIKDATQVTMAVEEVPHGTIPRFEYKVRPWTDERIKGLERVKYLEKYLPPFHRDGAEAARLKTE